MADPESKKILIVTYYWPPSGGGGVQRWLKFAKYLPHFGWEPIIFTPENPHFDLKDESLLKDVPVEIEVLKFPIWEPYTIFKKFSGTKELKQGQVLEEGKKGVMSRIAIWIRGNFFIPDPRVFWAKPSAQYLNTILETNQIKTIITTGPPHSIHLVGLKLKMSNPSITWFADFRDPWSKWDILPKLKVGKWALNRHKKLERRVLKAADYTLTVSSSWKKDFERLGARRVKTITNGFDEEDFALSKENQATDKFRISHMGMLNNMRNPIWFWRLLNDLAEDSSFRNNLELEFVGILSSDTLESLKSFPNLGTCLSMEGYLDHVQVLERYQRSSLLLLLQNDSENARGHLPGKLFEYLGAQRKILCIGNQRSDLAEILQETNAGSVFDSDHTEELEDFILKAYSDWQNGTTNQENGDVSGFSRRALTQQLANLLDSIGTR